MSVRRSPCQGCGMPIPANAPVEPGSTGYCKHCMEWEYCIVPTGDDDYEPVLGSSGFGLQWSGPDNRGAWETCGEPVVDYEVVWDRSSETNILLRKLAEKLPVAAVAPQPAPSETPAGSTASDVPVDTGNVLKLSGSVWQVRFGEEVGNFQDRPDSVLRHLARLLDEPNRHFSAAEFYPPPPGAAPLPYQGRDESSDPQALKDYEKRVRELVQEIKEADDAHDTETADKLRKEFDALTEHLNGEMGAKKRGHKKKCGTLSPEEKADQSLRVGLDRLNKRFRKGGMPKLADHLDKYLDNGGCEWWYIPPPGASPWRVTRPDSRPEK